MLTLSYAEALADPTYCDAGHKHGKKLARTMGVKPNEPRPLKDIFPYCTVNEFLWCFRAVRKSQRAEAIRLLVGYMSSVLERMEAIGYNNATIPQRVWRDKALDAYINGIGSAAEASQAAIDVSNLALRFFSDDPKAEERAQRETLERLINGA